MGYRSEVAYVIKFDDIEQRDAFVTLMLAKNDKHITEALGEVGHANPKDPIITAYFSDVKWYDNYSDVQAHHALMDEARNLYEASYRFVRVGEDANDVEISDVDDKSLDLWDYVDPVTSIRIGF